MPLSDADRARMQREYEFIQRWIFPVADAAWFDSEALWAVRYGVIVVLSVTIKIIEKIYLFVRREEYKP